MNLVHNEEILNILKSNSQLCRHKLNKRGSSVDNLNATGRKLKAAATARVKWQRQANEWLRESQMCEIQ